METIDEFCLRAGLTLLGMVVVLSGQTTPEESTRFEVASIRPSGAGGGRPSMEFTPGGGVRAANVTLKMLIQMAYDIRAEQVSGGPGWTDSEEYTVLAKGSGEAAQIGPARKRLQALLSERFHLALKQEVNAAAGYALTVAKQGHKMTAASEGATRQLRQVGRWEVRAERTEMSTLSRFLSVHLRGTVEDRTGLQGGFNFQLNWNPGLRDGEPVSSAEERAGDALVAAVEEQLGLRLERQKVPTARYTIEHAERPEN